MQNTIVCPKCEYEIEVSEALSAQVRDELRGEFEAKARKQVEVEVASQLAKEGEKLVKEAQAKAKESVAVELGDVRADLEETTEKLRESQQAELELRKERRELEEAKRELELTVNRRLDAEREKVRKRAKTEADDEHKLKDAEREKLISELRGRIAELKRKSEQGSQQAQGEVMELELEDILRARFPLDTIEPVPKGVHGGDVLQHVYDGSGMKCGTILWESKRTKAWSDSWLPKLRNDQRAAKAEVAALVTIMMPKDVSTFELIDGVWVTSRECLIGLATALRATVGEVATAKRALEGRQGKMELLYNYLASPEFRQRIEGIAEAFVTMRIDLETEKRAFQKAWAKREKQLNQAVLHTAGLHGDLSGIIGGALPAIESLELEVLPGTTSEAEKLASESTAGNESSEEGAEAATQPKPR